MNFYNYILIVLIIVFCLEVIFLEFVFSLGYWRRDKDLFVIVLGWILCLVFFFK